MDPVTHALSGAVAARATAPPDNHDLPTLRERTLAGGGAALFPDIDIVFRAVDPLFYLVHHRAITHSIVMAPVWALLLALIFAALFRWRYSWSAFYGVSLIGLLVHVFGDWINAYGTKLLAPITDTQFSFDTTFVLDPWLSGLLLLGLGVSVLWQPRWGARIGLILCSVLIALQWTQRQHAEALAQYYADTHQVEAVAVDVLPQPFHPFNWMLVLEERDRYYASRVNLAANTPLRAEEAWIGWRMLASYRPAGSLQWERFHRFAPGREHPSRQRWESELMSDYRHFTRLPAHYDITLRPLCYWFQDLQFRFPEMEPSFVYGVCGEDQDLTLHRLTLLTHQPKPVVRPERMRQGE